jgi:hypothetical protein
MVSVAMAFMPAAVSLLLLEALFMQITGVSLALTWPDRLCLLRVLLCATTTATSFPLSKHTGGGDPAPAFSDLGVCLQLRWEVGLPPSPVGFSSLHHSHKLSSCWLLGAHYRSHWSLSGPPSLFLYSSGKDSLPHPSALSDPHPLSHMSLLFLLLITQFLFFPRVEVSLSRGLC